MSNLSKLKTHDEFLLAVRESQSVGELKAIYRLYSVQFNRTKYRIEDIEQQISALNEERNLIERDHPIFGLNIAEEIKERIGSLVINEK